MNRNWFAFPAACSVLACPVFCANATLLTQEPTPPEVVHQQIFERLRAMTEPARKATNTGTKAPGPAASDVVTMDPYVLKDARVPIIHFRTYPTPLDRFIRTGTIKLHDDEKYSSVFFVQLVPVGGNAGPVGTAIKPTIKPEVGINIKW